VRGSRALTSIQILRAVAALGVLFHHTAHEVAAKTGVTVPFGELVVGAGGVDLFFVISGFVMVYASERLFAQPGATRMFFLRRLARIVPLYWAATAILVGYVYVAHRIFPPPFVTTEGVIASFLFIPYPLPSGLMAPVHALGWTLNYEMFFYVIFAAALFTARTMRLAILTIAIAGLAITGLILRPQGDLAATYTDPIMLEFLAGVWLGVIWTSRVSAGPLLCVVLVASGLGLLALLSGAGNVPRVLVWGLPATLIVGGIALYERDHTVPKWPWLLLLGDASYSIYLWHFPTNSFWDRLAEIVHAPAWLAVAIMVVCGTAFGIAAHLLIEKPIRRWLRARRKPDGPRNIPAEPVSQAP
jgi:exopolysaccharide production protein ExoZ